MYVYLLLLPQHKQFNFTCSHASTAALVILSIINTNIYRHFHISANENKYNYTNIISWQIKTNITTKTVYLITLLVMIIKLNHCDVYSDFLAN